MARRRLVACRGDGRKISDIGPPAGDEAKHNSHKHISYNKILCIIFLHEVSAESALKPRRKGMGNRHKKKRPRQYTSAFEYKLHCPLRYTFNLRLFPTIACGARRSGSPLLFPNPPAAPDLRTVQYWSRSSVTTNQDRYL